MQLKLIGKSRAKYAKPEVAKTVRLNDTNIGVGVDVIDLISKRAKVPIESHDPCNVYFAVNERSELFVCLTQKHLRGAEPFMLRALSGNQKSSRNITISSERRRLLGINASNGKYVPANSTWVDGHLWTLLVPQYSTGHLVDDESDI